MKINKSIILTLIALALIFFSNFSFASEDDEIMNHKIIKIFDGNAEYSIVDLNDIDVTIEILDKFGDDYKITEVCDYLAQKNYSIKQIIGYKDGSIAAKGIIANRHYGATYSRKVSKVHNGILYERTITFEILGELDFDTSTGTITTVYYPSLYIVNIDNPTSISSAQVSSGTLSNNNMTVTHIAVINSKITVPVYGNIYEWVDMPTIVQNFSYTPSTY